MPPPKIATMMLSSSLQIRTCKLCIYFIISFFFLNLSSSKHVDFTFNGFNNANLILNGIASVKPNGLLELTNTDPHNGHAFYHLPLQFKSTTQKNKTNSFSTCFAFAIRSDPYIDGHGLAFVIAPTSNFSTALPKKYLGLFNYKSNGNSSSHVFAVELDTIRNHDFKDLDSNHVGVDANSLTSVASHSAGYFEDGTNVFKNLILRSGQSMEVWIDFDGHKSQLNVTLSVMGMAKPSRPLITTSLDLSTLMLDSMYVGFSGAGNPFHAYHYVLGWSFKMNGVAKALDYKKLPSILLPKGKSNALAVWLPICSSLFTFLMVAFIVFMVHRRLKFAEVREEWELEYSHHRFSYKDLYHATKGFNQKELLGSGGFGRVYKGVLPKKKLEVAVKRVAYDSTKGIQEFVAEIVSIGQLRHRNLVQFLGYCRRKEELFLVYNFMPNGSLDKLLYTYGANEKTLTWAQRYKIVKGVASALLYMHEDWAKVVIHRDIKASNVLLDGEMSGRLGDFGLVRFYESGKDPKTTHVVGTMGYLAPELVLTGRATTATDVFAYGAFLLEVVCGRRPNGLCTKYGQELVLVDWVIENWRNGTLLETVDPRLKEEYCVSEVEVALKLGLLCSNPKEVVRPSMRQVMQVFDGDLQLSDLLWSDHLRFSKARLIAFND